MPSASPQSRRKFFNIAAICLIVLAALAIRPIKVLYHESAMRRAWASTFQQGATNSQDIAVFERHRDALVGLRYLQKQSFPVDQIKPRSPEHKALYEALNQHATEASGYFSTQGFESSTPIIVIVWATPADMPGWEALIKSYQDRKSVV